MFIDKKNIYGQILVKKSFSADVLQIIILPRFMIRKSKHPMTVTSSAIKAESIIKTKQDRNKKGTEKETKHCIKI